MFRLSKRVEYGLMALQHLARRSGVATAREIADAGDIPYDLLAKVMQSLKRDGIIDSYQGVKGGYALMLTPDAIPLKRVIEALEEDVSLTDCNANGAEGCDRFETCTIREPLGGLQRKMAETFSGMTIAQLL
jgi:Rrf2 family protein